MGKILEMGKKHVYSTLWLGIDTLIKRGGIIYDMNVNEHEKQANFTLRHKLKQRKYAFIAVLQ